MWKLWAAAGVVGVLMAAAIAVQTARLETSHEREKAANQRADDNAAVVTALKADEKLKADVIRDQAAALAKVQIAKNEVIREIITLPPSSSCVGSPAVGAALRGMRTWPGATPQDGRPDAAGQPRPAVRTPPPPR